MSACRAASGFVLVILLTAIPVAACSRLGSRQSDTITASEQHQRMEEEVRRCASEPTEKALEACHTAVRLGLVESGVAFPDSQLFYERIGRTLVNEQKHDAALNTYREGLSRYPENGCLHYQLGLLLVEQYGAYEEAYGPLLEAARWDAQSKQALALLGEVQTQLRRYAESNTSFEAALRIDPHYVDALVGLGRSLRSQGRSPDAVLRLLRAVELAPDNGFAQEELGGALLDSSRPMEAVEPLQRAVKLMDDPRAGYCMLSIAFARIGQEDESRKACELARKPRPSHRGEPVCACR